MESATVETRIAALEADLAATTANYDASLDAVWMLTASARVFFMHCGFTAFETGCVRYKNAKHVLAKNISVTILALLCWYCVGYSLAFGEREDSHPFIGSSSFVAMQNFSASKDRFRQWLFQGLFCATSATIVSGAMAERTRLIGFMIYTVALTAFVHPIVACWVWSGHGFLCHGVGESFLGPGFKDFAGSGVVHLVGGVSALCGAVVVGPRVGRWDEDKVSEFKAHNMTLCVLGSLFLWFGWYGFNSGSTLTMHDRATAHRAALVAVNTTLCPCSSGLLCLFLRKVFIPPYRVDVGALCNGCLAGLVSITASCGFVKPWEALIIGTFGGLLYTVTSLRVRIARVDDVVDAFAVHGACGFWGVLAAGIFGNSAEGLGGNGVLYKGNQLGIQALGAVVITLWAACSSIAILVPLYRYELLRYSDRVQRLGADAVRHVPEGPHASDLEIGSCMSPRGSSRASSRGNSKDTTSSYRGRQSPRGGSSRRSSSKDRTSQGSRAQDRAARHSRSRPTERATSKDSANPSRSSSQGVVGTADRAISEDSVNPNPIRSSSKGSSVSTPSCRATLSSPRRLPSTPRKASQASTQVPVSSGRVLQRGDSLAGSQKSREPKQSGAADVPTPKVQRLARSRSWACPEDASGRFRGEQPLPRARMIAHVVSSPLPPPGQSVRVHL